jgi:hypothetical protein
MNPIHPSTLVNISGSPIVSHDSYPLLTMPTILFFPFLYTTSAWPESPAEFRLNRHRKSSKIANLNKSKRRCRDRKRFARCNP